MKLTTKIGGEKTISQVKELIVEVHPDYIEKDGYVWRYNEDTKRYYNTGICLMGLRGNPGPRGAKGDTGLSAYQLAKERGFQGTVEQWLKSLKGKSAYEIAVDNGFEGTVEEWLANIVNEDISGKEDSLEIIEVDGTDILLSCSYGKYYKFLNAIDTLEISLPAIDSSNKVKGFMCYLTTSNSPAITISSESDTIKYSDSYSIEANKTYEINCLANGSEWVITNFEIL